MSFIIRCPISQSKFRSINVFLSCAARPNHAHAHGLELEHERAEAAAEERLPALAYPSSATVLILDDDHSGVFGFAEKCLHVPDSRDEITFNVHRFIGSCLLCSALLLYSIPLLLLLIQY